jgi:hypothetical protein
VSLSLISSYKLDLSFPSSSIFFFNAKIYLSNNLTFFSYSLN